MVLHAYACNPHLLWPTWHGLVRGRYGKRAYPCMYLVAIVQFSRLQHFLHSVRLAFHSLFTAYMYVVIYSLGLIPGKPLPAHIFLIIFLIQQTFLFFLSSSPYCFRRTDNTTSSSPSPILSLLRQLVPDLFRAIVPSISG
ncbi:hypothetical protein F4776DRAFT_554545 [Hypoxylon sp. NC0597]|nr:hypothetical protein F4776DRAFT_554545 [Hypoxylon sp. NC0597]